MPRIDVGGIGIAYELLGRAGDPAVVLTPGGRFAMDVPGLREMAEGLVAAGRRVLLYDRPNCGASDASLLGESESEMQAEALSGLIRRLDLGPALIAGGSGGSRVSMLAAARDPEICSHLVLWWISGDPIGLMQLATYYCGEAATLASRGGMEAVLQATSWAENLAKSPQAREFILAQDPDRFIAVMQKWAAAYGSSPSSPVPGMTQRDFARLTMAVLVFRSGCSDRAPAICRTRGRPRNGSTGWSRIRTSSIRHGATTSGTNARWRPMADRPGIRCSGPGHGWWSRSCRLRRAEDIRRSSTDYAPYMSWL